MKIKIAPDDPQSMSQDGDAILRSLQNKHLPMVDLMVRESLQNSLDASLENNDNTIVNFNVGKFQSEKLAVHLEGITDKLKARYTGEQKYIAIRDKNTTGLTGEYFSNDINVLNNSNFHKLVFGIGKNQNKEGAGGSWGLGKTSYFRIGSGVVIYYTRIKTSDGYEERLIASLIESPKDEYRILTQSDRGIAWWGIYNDENGDIISPITEESYISEILDIFSLQRYSGSQTGTTIIIPYVGDLHQSDDSNTLMPWEYNDENLLNIVVQRWYLPRLFNKKYLNFTDNSMLECSVNNTFIIPKINTEPVFEIFQELYNAALTKESEDDSITIKDIKLGQRAMKTKSIPVGTVAFKEVSREDLKMLPPDNKRSALDYIGHREKELSEKNDVKIMAYSRSPGMIIEYDTDGDWFPKELIQKEGHLLCAFFVPNSKGELSNVFADKDYKNLEAYLRSTENADHAKWLDEDGYTIVQRMKNYTSRAIQQKFQTGEERVKDSATSALSRKFGNLLLPPAGFGRNSSRKKLKDKDEPPKKIKRSRESDITVIKSNIISDNEVKIYMNLSLKKVQRYKLFIHVITQDQKLTYEDWVKSVGTDVPFPFNIESTSLKADNEENSLEDKIILTEESIDSLVVDNRYKENLEIDLEMVLNTRSEDFIPGLAIRSM